MKKRTVEQFVRLVDMGQTAYLHTEYLRNACSTAVRIRSHRSTPLLFGQA